VTKRHLATATAAVLLALGLSACGEEAKDAPRGTEDTGPADIIQFPDGFSNVAHKCDGPNMVYSSTNGAGTENAESNRASISVVPNDPRCTDKAVQ
jgi:hypothetical protein